MTSHDLLLKWSRDRDELAFREIVHRHAPMVFATSRRILRNDTEAEDVTQECFETLAGARKLPGHHLAAWLHRVATNRCLDRLRAAGRRAHREIDFASRDFKANATDWNDIYDLVDDAIAELPDKWRDVVVAHFLEGRSQADIANELNLTRQAVHERLGRGIEALRASLKHRGVQIPAATLTALLVQHLTCTEIPTTLAASLGKLALSTHAVAATGILTGLSLGKLIIGAVILVSVVAVGWFAQNAGQGSRSITAAVPAAVDELAATNMAASVAVEPSSAAPASASSWPNGPSNMAPPVVVQGTLKPEPKSAAASVSGIVFRADGKIYPHAKVWFMSTTEGSHGGGSVEADADGGFLMKELDAGEYRVCVMPPGFGSANSRAEVAKLTLERNEQRTDFRLYVGKGRSKIEGKITDTAGKPIKGISVDIFDQYSAYSVAATDEYGRYTLEALPEGKYTLEAEDDPFIHGNPEVIRFARAVIQAETGDTNANFVLERNINLEGRVLRADTRAPIPNFRVSFRNGHAQEFDESLMENYKDISDTKGQFRFEYAWPGDLTVSATADGFEPAYIHTHGNDGATISGLEILLSPGHALTGMVVDVNGQPIANATIRNGKVSHPIFLENVPIAATTDASGAFTIADAPSADSFLAAYHAGFAATAVRIASGTVKIVLQQAASLKVTATAPEDMLTDAHVLIFYGRDANADYCDGAKFDKDGVAAESNLIPGPVMVHINRRNDTDKSYIERNAMLHPGQETEIHVDFAPITASLNGIVTWHGGPAANATLFLQVETTVGLELYEATTDRDGSYSFADVPAGKAALRVEVWEDPKTVKRNIVNDLYLTPDDVTTYNINLLGASVISGHVSGLEKPDTALLVVFEGSHTFEELASEPSLGPFGLFDCVRWWLADAEGNYSLGDLEPGEYTVLAGLLPEGDWAAAPQFFAVEHVTITANQTAVADFTYH